MRVKSPFSCRRSRAAKRWAVAMMIGMVLSPVASLLLQQTAVQAQTAPVGAGFVIDANDLRFIYEQILVAQDHAAGGNLLGPGPNQVSDPQLPRGLRTVDGSFNNLVPSPDQHMFGAAARLFPRLLGPRFRTAQNGTSYAQTGGTVIDSEPRTISNLIVDQSPNNPSAQFAHDNPCGSGGFVCGDPAPPEPGDPTGSLFIPNITPDFGLSAPFNLMFTFFGQFFDHGLDLVPKSGGSVVIPLQADDPLFVPGAPNFMVMTRGEVASFSAGPDGQLGTADDVRESVNQTTPWVDQNQTYTSHPSHQVFLRQYVLQAGRPVPDGKVLDGDHCAPRGTGFVGDDIYNIGNWAQVKAQASNLPGMHLGDRHVLDVPLIVTAPYGHFKPGPNGFPMMVRPGNVLVEGNPNIVNPDGRRGVSVPADAFRTAHAFLNDIAHNAVPVDANSNPLPADTDTTICDFRTTPSS